MTVSTSSLPQHRNDGLKRLLPSSATRMAAYALIAATLALLTCLLAPSPSALAAPVSVVPDDSFAPEHYSWYFDFESVEADAGFQYIEDLAPYYSKINHSDPSQDRYDCVKKGDHGYAAFIGRDTSPLDESGKPRFSLKFSQGTYEGIPVDAVLTLKNWTYIEPSNGWDDYWLRNPEEPSYIETFATGVYYNPCYTNDSSKKDLAEQPSLSNINLYLNGISNLEVELAFYEAGTETPVAVSGHATCIDLDVRQAVTFGSGVAKAEIAQSATNTSPAGAPFLSVDDQSGRVQSSSYAIAANDSDDSYQCGLVGAYFDTSAFVPFSLTFESSWVGETNPDGSPGFSVSFFALTPEYVANPSISDLVTVKKSVRQEHPAAKGDTVSFSVDLTLPVEGKTCRVGYRYRSLEITDVIEEGLSPLEQSIAVSLAGVTIPNAALAYYDQSSHTLTVQFSESFLAETRMLGQTYSLTFDARVTGYPKSDGSISYEIPNKACVTVNDSATVESNTVFVTLAQGAITIEKVDSANPDIKLPGAVFSLYHAETNECLASEITTNENGEALVNNLPLGRYRLEETASPRGYKLSADPTEFEITEDDTAKPLLITKENDAVAKSVLITKTIPASNRYEGHGKPTFLFLLHGQDIHGEELSYCAYVRFEGDESADENGKLTASCAIDNIPAGTYTLEEMPSLRYEETEIEANGTIDGKAVTFNLVDLEQGLATFENEKVSAYGGSDTALAVNRFKAEH